MPNWSGGASGAATGYTTGSTFGGPIGGAIGAGVGGLIGLFKKKKPKVTGPSNMDPTSDYASARAGYEDFARTGGFTPQGLANIRSRAVSPIRSVYAGAQREVGRQRALQGGYSPNYTAAMAKMAREQSMNMADASTNVEAGIAGMQQEGRLAGLSGISGLYGTRISNPSDYQRKLSSIGSTMETGGKIAEGLSKIFK